MNTMQTKIAGLMALMLLISSSAFAAEGGAGVAGSLLLILFLGFFALIIVFQLVPAFLLFAGLLKGLFGKPQEAPQKTSRI